MYSKVLKLRCNDHYSIICTRSAHTTLITDSRHKRYKVAKEWNEEEDQCGQHLLQICLRLWMMDRQTNQKYKIPWTTGWAGCMLASQPGRRGPGTHCLRMRGNFLENQETVILFVHDRVTTTSQNDPLSCALQRVGTPGNYGAQVRVGISYADGIRWEGRACVESPSATRFCHLFPGQFSCWPRLPKSEVQLLAGKTAMHKRHTRELLREAMAISTTKCDNSIKTSRSIIPQTEIRNGLFENVILQPNYVHAQTVRTRPSSAWLRG